MVSLRARWAVFLLGTGHTAVIVLVLVLGVVCDGIIAGGTAALFAEIFPTEVRYSDASLGYQVAAVIGGSLTPTIGVALLHRIGSVLPVVTFVLAMLALTAVAMKMAGETRARDLATVC